MNFSRVLDHFESMLLSQREDWIGIYRKPIGVHHHYGFGARRDEVLYLAHIHIPGLVTIDKDRLCSVS